MSRTLLVCVPSSNLSLAGDLAQFIRTDVLLACVRERVKNVHATYTVKNATHPDSGFPGSPPCTCVSFVCASTSTKSINPEIVFTLHIIERATSNGGGSPSRFSCFTRECQSPTFVVDTLFGSLLGGLTHTDSHTGGYPTQRPPSKDPPRLSCFWRRRLLAFSLLLPCAFPLYFYASDTGSLDENR